MRPLYNHFLFFIRQFSLYSARQHQRKRISLVFLSSNEFCINVFFQMKNLNTLLLKYKNSIRIISKENKQILMSFCLRVLSNL